MSKMEKKSIILGVVSRIFTTIIRLEIDPLFDLLVKESVYRGLIVVFVGDDKPDIVDISAHMTSIAREMLSNQKLVPILLEIPEWKKISEKLLPDQPESVKE